MKPIRNLSCLMFLGAGLSLSCASSAVDLDLESTEAQVAEATGQEITLHPLAERLTPAEFEAILADGLTLAEAEQLTLRNNRHLQAKLLEVGMAQADLVQAGLLQNPTLDLAIRFSGDGTGNLIDALLGFALLDFWQVPARERAAEFALQATVAEVARVAVGHLRQTRGAYLDAQIASESVAVHRQRSRLAQAQYQAVRDLVMLGMEEELAMKEAKARWVQVQAEQSAAEAAHAQAMQTLAGQLSWMAGLEQVTLTEPFTDRRIWEGEADALVQLALAQRLDLRALAWKREALAAELALRERQRFGALSGGASFEDPGSGDTALGPAISWSIPLFDRNQAGIAKAEFALAQADLQLEAAMADAAQAVRSAWTGLHMVEEHHDRLKLDLLPNARARKEQIGAAMELGAAGQGEYLDAQLAELELLLEYLETEKTLQNARWGLELALGGSFPE